VLQVFGGSRAKALMSTYPFLGLEEKKLFERKYVK
jgi:hypothetical protein